MIVKLKCVDNGNCDYFTKGKVYESNDKEFGMFLVVGDDGFSYRVDHNKKTNIWSDKFEVVNE